MEKQLGSNVEESINCEVLGSELASWNSPRTTEQLLGFIARREAELSVVDFDEA